MFTSTTCDASWATTSSKPCVAWAIGWGLQTICKQGRRHDDEPAVAFEPDPGFGLCLDLDPGRRVDAVRSARADDDFSGPAAGVVGANGCRADGADRDATQRPGQCLER